MEPNTTNSPESSSPQSSTGPFSPVNTKGNAIGENSFFTMNVLGALILGLLVGFFVGMLFARNSEKVGDTLGNNQESFFATTTPTSTPAVNQGNGATTTRNQGATSTSIVSTQPQSTVGVTRSTATISDTTAGSRLTFGTLTLDNNYWVVVREAGNSDAGGIIASRRVAKGTYRNVFLPLNVATEVGKTYEVVLYRDSGATLNSNPQNLVLVNGTSVVLASFRAS
jgi:hypothetical protein